MELDRLYAAPLEQFVKLRNEIATLFRKEDNPAAAARISGLRKPSVTAWAVNQLARSNELDIQRLIRAGEALESAQREALAGGAPAGFGDARREEASATRLLRNAAKKLMPKISTTTLDRITNTLRAAVATAEGRQLIKKGRLTQDLEAPGFDMFSTGIDSRASPKPTHSKADAGTQQQKRIEALRDRKRKAAENAKRLAEEATDLEREAREAENLARRADRVAVAARKRAEATAEEVKLISAQLSELEKGG